MGDRAVALKIMSGELVTRPERRARFVQEAEAALQIDSPFVVEVYAVGSLEDGRPYIVMELLDGEDLGRLLERVGSLDEQRAVELVIHALSGLAHAHSRGVLHRDIKPANLFIVRPSDDAGGGEDEILKIVDFGISKVLASGNEAQGLTRTNVVLGSPVYMSPEQCRGAKNMDHRSDIYSVGVVLYECLTGRVPHAGENVNEIMFEIALKDAPDPRTFKPSLDPALAAIVMKALARNPDERFQSASAFREALLEWGAERGARVPPTPSSSSRMRVLTPRRLRRLEVALEDEEEAPAPVSESAPRIQRLRDALEPDPAAAAAERRRTIALYAAVGVALVAIALGIFLGGREEPKPELAASANEPSAPLQESASAQPEVPVDPAVASASATPVAKAAAKPGERKPTARKASADGGAGAGAQEGHPSNEDSTEEGEHADESSAAASKPEATEPEATKPEATKPETTKSEATKPETTKPEATKPVASTAAGGGDAPIAKQLDEPAAGPSDDD